MPGWLTCAIALTNMCDCINLLCYSQSMAAVPAATCFRAALPTDQSILNYMCKVAVSVVPELKKPSLPRISPGFYVYLRSLPSDTALPLAELASKYEKKAPAAGLCTRAAGLNLAEEALFGSQTFVHFTENLDLLRVNSARRGALAKL